MEPISINTHFATLKAFNNLCRKDRSITAAAQLIYRLLIEEANRSRWNDSFTLPIEEMEAITGLARQTVINARMRLKSKGLVHFEGKPSRYTVYSLVDHEADHSGTPTPPVKNNQTKTKEERKERRKAHADLHHSHDARINPPAPVAEVPPNQSDLQAQLQRRIAELQASRSNHL